MTSKMAVPLPTSSGLLPDAGVPGAVLAGWTIHSTGVAGAQVRVWDNASVASGTILLQTDLTAPGTVGCFDNFQIDPVFVRHGIWVELVAGTVEGSIWVN